MSYLDERPAGVGQWQTELMDENRSLREALSTEQKRLKDSCRRELILRRDLDKVKQIAEHRRVKIEFLQREVESQALALKAIEAALHLSRFAVREIHANPRVVHTADQDKAMLPIGPKGQEIKPE